MSKNELNKQDIINILKDIHRVIDENKDYLSKLDTEIGDGDHGTSMARGFKSLADKLEEISESDIGTILKKAGFELIKTIGGSAGAIFGTFFTGQASYYEKNLKGKETIRLEDIAGMFNEALEQIKKRGNAGPGDKTMIDALKPAVESLKDAVNKNMSLAEAFKNAATSAKGGAEKTKEMIGKHGRSKYLGERGKGFIDPGAESTYLIFQTIADYLLSLN